MKEKKTKDPIVTELMNQLADRSNRMNKVQAIENSIEELLDAAVYLKKAVHELKEEEDELYLGIGGTR